MISNIINAKHIDLISFASCPVEMMFQGSVVAHGTGFVWRDSGKSYLVTNWHNFTGKNPFSGKLLSKTGAVPDSVRLHVARRVSGSKDVYRARTAIDVPLYKEFHDPLWFQHKDFGHKKIDIAIIKIESVKMKNSISVLDFGFEKLFSHVGSEVFIVGYPNTDFHENMPPIWKRGSLASEPLIDWHGKPAFLIDAASRSGMSGSPVFRRVFGPATIVQEDGDKIIKLDSIMVTDFVGIYSGHLSDMGEQLTIGIGWSRNLIDDIFKNPSMGTRD